jgi:hypothetical protein
MEFFNSQPLGAPPVVSPRAPLHSPANPVPQKPAPQK